MSKERYNQIIDEVYETYLKNGQPEADRNRESQTFLPMPKQMFINKCKTDSEFSEKCGIQIEERELTLEERFNIRYPVGKFSAFQENWPNTHKRNDPNGLLDAFNISTKLITLTYKNKKIESYE